MNKSPGVFQWQRPYRWIQGRDVFRLMYMFMPAGGKPRQRFVRFFFQTCTFGTLRHGFGVGVGGMLTFMLTCGTCACYVTSWVWGWGGVGGDVNVHVNLRHMRVLRHVMGWGWGGGGMLTFMLTCGTCACYVTSWVRGLGWGGGDVNVHVNLRHMRVLRHVGGQKPLSLQVKHWILWNSHQPKKQCWWLMERRAIHLWVPNLVGGMKLATTLKGIFCIKKRIGNKTVLIHTGGVDAMWRLSKSAIPYSLATRVNSQVSPKLMRSIRVWQWRWLNSKENLLEKTGRTLQKRMAMWEKEKIARVFKTKFTVNYRTSSKIHLIFPGKIQPFLWCGSVVSLWRKRHFFQNAQNAGAVFPPTGCFCVFYLTWQWTHTPTLFDDVHCQMAMFAAMFNGRYIQVTRDLLESEVVLKQGRLSILHMTIVILNSLYFLTSQISQMI